MANNNDKKVLNVPALRFPEFSGEWKHVHLKKLLSFRNRGFLLHYSTIIIIFQQKIFYRILKAYNALPLCQQM